MSLRPRGWLAVAGTVGAAAALAWLVWPSSPGLPVGAAPARQYLNLSVCLLTDAHGVAAAPAAAVWSGMQQSSLATRARVTYLPVMGPATETDALPYLASLLQRHCSVVLGVGPAQAAAVTADAARYPLVRFFIVGGAAGRGAGSAPVSGPARPTQITRLTGLSASHVRAEVSKAVTEAVNQASAQ